MSRKEKGDSIIHYLLWIWQMFSQQKERAFTEVDLTAGSAGRRGLSLVKHSEKIVRNKKGLPAVLFPGRHR
ncbi:hypothetical protein AOLI_G00166680 [Acnodon oligacanthus]